MAHRHGFIATYRIQLSRSFTLWDLIARVDYLHALGISHLYLSPLMESVTGSSHGYDVTDFAAVSAERGGEKGLKALDAKLRGMSPPMHMILDIVPNHMSASPQNRYWRDVLAKGRSSPYWRFFDLRVLPGQKIEIPVLPDEADSLIRARKIFLEQDGAEVSVNTPAGRYPVSAESMAGLQAAFKNAGGAEFGAFLDGLSATEVRDVLCLQNYTLVSSARGPHSVSYRRFFHIADFVALRMEDPHVFETTHRKLFELTRAYASIAGVRVDHVDGLAQPAQYLESLSAKIPNIWVEKILGRNEKLPAWRCHGTTGYEFIDCLNQLMIDRNGLDTIEARWKRRSRIPWNEFGNCASESRVQALEQLFPGEVGRLGGILGGAGGRSTVMKLTAAMPVYRLYDSQAAAGNIYTPFFREWQKLTGAVMAKGVEDCAHYRYTPLTALNEVGCTPVPGGSRTSSFLWLSERGQQWPLSLSAGTTHDTKRSEDVRHRLYALADMPEEWEALAERALRRWGDKGRIGPATILFFLQAVLGAWPLDGVIDEAWRERIWSYMQKAAREAALDTCWNIRAGIVRKSCMKPGFRISFVVLWRMMVL
jgi:(1->4)-alpha-D-glucan 1-alpha-D-glucosylmutase